MAKLAGFAKPPFPVRLRYVRAMEGSDLLRCNIGPRLAPARRKAGLTKAEATARPDLTNSSLSIERGRRSIDAALYRTDPGRLVGEEPERKEHNSAMEYLEWRSERRGIRGFVDRALPFEHRFFMDTGL